MGTTLTGTTPQDTYDSLIKVTDNGPLTGSLKKLTDGLGNDSSLSLSTTAASFSGTLAATGAATLSSTLAVSGDTTLSGASGNRTLNIQTNTSGSPVLALIAAGDDSAALTYNRGAGYLSVGVSSVANAMVVTSTGSVGIGTTAPTTTLDVLGTSFLRGNVNAGKTANINVTTAVNGTGGGNREFTTFTGASATGFTGTDSTDQGHGYFAATIVSGRSYEVSATMVVTNGAPLSFITSTGLNFATDTVQTVQSSPASNTTYRFVASGAASFFGIAASNSGGGMTCVVSNFSLKEVGSVLVTSDSNVGVGTTAPAVKLDVVGDIRSSTGILFGSDTAAANLLDDYEEGTFTATLKGSTTDPTTPVTTTGTYTKIGRQVAVSIIFGNVNTTGAAGSVTIIGLPFPVVTAGEGAVTTELFTFGAGRTNISSHVDSAASTTVRIFASGNDTGFDSLTHNAGAGRYLYTSLTYFV